MTGVQPNSRFNSKADFKLLALVVAGIVAVIMLSRVIDQHRPPVQQGIAEENLYLNGNTAKRLSLGFNGLVADWYWMRSLQYVGRKVLDSEQGPMLDNLGTLNLKLLAPLLDNATTLDPTFIEPYEYAAIVLPGVDTQAAIRITQKGIAANPSSWRLYHQLGYIYWQQGDYATAAATYDAGARIPGAPQWMNGMKAKMSLEGGSRTTAREIYSRMLQDSTDPKIRDMATVRLKQLDSLDQRDLIRKVLAGYKTKRNQCPSSWVEIAPALQAFRIPLDRQAAPLDPAGFPYLLISDTCDVALDPASSIPKR